MAQFVKIALGWILSQKWMDYDPKKNTLKLKTLPPEEDYEELLKKLASLEKQVSLDDFTEEHQMTAEVLTESLISLDKKNF